MELQTYRIERTMPVRALWGLSVAVISIMIAGCGSSGGGASLPYVEDFAGSCNGWSKQDDALLKAGCVDGEYQVLVRDARDSQIFSVPVDTLPSVSVGADMRLAAGPKPQVYGVGCWSESFAAGYWFVLALGAGGTDQGYAIVKYERDAGGQAALTSIAVKKHDLSAGTTRRIRGKCAGDTLRMSVDGRAVLTAKNAVPLEAVEHSGVVVYPAASGSDVRIDNVSVETLEPTLTARAKLVAVVSAAARRASDSPPVAVTCPKTLAAGEIGLSTCAVTFAGPSCQLWIVINKDGKDKPLPFSEPAQGRHGLYDEASGMSKCVKTN